MLSFKQAPLLAVSLSISAISIWPSWLAAECSPNQQAIDKNKILRPADLDKMAIYIEADQALFREQGISELSGNVHISQADKALRADQARFDRQTQQISAQGNIQFQTQELHVSSQDIEYNLSTGLGRINDVAYLLNGVDGRGRSDELVQTSKTITRLSNATYTTCPPKKESWSLKASSIELNRETDTGTAKQVSLTIYDQAILYLPYFSFPLSDQRKSGLLTPSFGTDEKTGVRISIPYYFNLAPNYDLTTTTNFLSKRGIQFENEFRYLTDIRSGSIEYDLLPSDQERNNEARYYLSINHHSQPTANSELDLKAESVSDSNYFKDLGGSLAATSIVNLERTLKYQLSEQEWNFSALAQSYQVLDAGNENYARLPQLQLNWIPSDTYAGFDVAAHSEYTYFQRSRGDNGHRLDVEVSAKQRFENDFAYLEPALKLQHTHYQLERGSDSNASRTVPTASVDAGLFLERALANGKGIQTLEPRLYYTFTPFRAQDALPVYDSSIKTLSYSQLFTDNRFTGKDRIADHNRLSTSLTTRFYHTEKGREVLRASVGQMYYFEKSRVTLPEETSGIGTRSEAVVELAGDINDATRVTGTAFIDTDQKQVSAHQIKLNYRDQRERVLNLGYSERHNEYAAAQISFATPVTSQWKVVGGYERDVKNDRLLESIAAAEYQSCCWTGRLAARKYLLADNINYDDAIFVEVELKGLGSFGSGTRQLLENRIYGYE